MAKRKRSVPSKRNTQSSPSAGTDASSVAPDATAEGQEWQSEQDASQGADDENNGLQGASSARIEDELEDASDDEEVIRTPDGGAIIRKKNEPKKSERKHFANLAADPDLKDKLSALAHKLWQEIEIDIEEAKKSVDKYATALEATGQTGKAPGGAQFAGASTVTHPIMGEVCADYAARVCREMLPPKGPAKPHIEGSPTKEKYERAKRVARYINWQLRRQVRNFAPEMEQAFAQQPFTGGSYIKAWRVKKKLRVAFVPMDKVHRPSNGDDFYSCERITHEMTLTKRQLEMDMRKGLYVTHEFGSGVDPEKTKAQEVADKTTGTEEPIENIDESRPVYETSCFWDGEDDDGEKKPYIITFDKESKVVLSCYRNWEKNDEDCERLDFIYEFPFWPFRDGKPIGLAHMLSGLPRAATGALRACLDAALARNFPGAYKLKGGQSGSNTSPNPGEVQELENATAVDDIKKLVLPVNAGSATGDQTLFQLLGFVVDAARGVVRTTFDDIIGKGRSDIPVGTMMMLVDEGTMVYSSIFGRQHRAMERLLQGLYRLNKQIVTDRVKFSDLEGDERVTRSDFEGDAVLAPVSDPRINSATQRWTRANFVAARAGDQLNMGLYDRYEAEKFLLESAEIENIDILLVKPQKPIELGAVNENVAASLGKPITAFPEQDHLAHLEQHADFVMSPTFGASNAFAPTLVPAMVQHFKEHMVMAYAAETLKLVDEAIASVTQGKNELIEEFRDLMADAKTQQDKLSVVDMMRLKDPDLGRLIDRMFAAASRSVITKMEKTFENIAPMLQKLAIMAQQFKPPMPMDPTQAAIQTATIAATTQKEITQLRGQSDVQKTQMTLAAKADLEAQKLAQAGSQHAVDAELEEAGIAAKHQMNTQDNVTALTIAQAELATGEKVAVSTGTGINP
jgi:hypothetical protein